MPWRLSHSLSARRSKLFEGQEGAFAGIFRLVARQKRPNGGHVARTGLLAQDREQFLLRRRLGRQCRPLTQARLAQLPDQPCTGYAALGANSSSCRNIVSVNLALSSLMSSFRSVLRPPAVVPVSILTFLSSDLLCGLRQSRSSRSTLPLGCSSIA
jgi:hypothetical protein